MVLPFWVASKAVRAPTSRSSVASWSRSMVSSAFQDERKRRIAAGDNAGQLQSQRGQPPIRTVVHDSQLMEQPVHLAEVDRAACCQILPLHSDALGQVIFLFFSENRMWRGVLPW